MTTGLRFSLLLTVSFWLFSDLPSLLLFPISWEISRVSPLCGFRAKTDKGIVWLVPTPTETNATHRATMLIGFISLFNGIWNILHFPKKDDLRIAKNYRGITRTSIAKIYNVLLLNHIEPEINLRHHKFWQSVEFSVFVQNPRCDTIIYRLLQGIWLHTKREDGANTSRLRCP